MKYLLITSTVFLSGCFATITTTPQFPVAPPILLEHCPQLQKADPSNGSLRDMLQVVIENYSSYYQCAAKTHGWQEWYNEQREIYKDIDNATTKKN